MKATERKAQRTQATLADPRWGAIVARDAQADGSFLYSVRTTGVYCRPSCAARLARPENVLFHASTADAEQAGFRPCKRCKPGQPSRSEETAAKVTEACRIIEQSEVVPSLEQLAGRVGMSAYHFHRIFKSRTGLTPREYASAQRETRVRSQLGSGASVTEAIFTAGYQSNSRFYEKANRVLGMTPTRYRAGGPAMEIRFAVGECALGSILVAQSAVGICAILMGDDPDQLARDLQDRFPKASLIPGEAGYEQLVAKVVGMVQAPGLGLDLPLDIRGTAFQQRVWHALREIPPGETRSYTELAHRIGTPAAVRAVAQACGANGLAIAIPCHRVVRIDGALAGYRWGVERKALLLESEAQALANKEGFE
jgi:AraC family transcriptional regulator, regulatory protein of adaptative response / methylated-DNA-[protein]-cysteine methyltransferase